MGVIYALILRGLARACWQGLYAYSSWFDAAGAFTSLAAHRSIEKIEFESTAKLLRPSDDLRKSRYCSSTHVCERGTGAELTAWHFSKVWATLVSLEYPEVLKPCQINKWAVHVYLHFDRQSQYGPCHADILCYLCLTRLQNDLLVDCGEPVGLIQVYRRFTANCNKDVQM